MAALLLTFLIAALPYVVSEPSASAANVAEFPFMRKIDELYQNSHSVPGISHITVAGALMHGFKEVEIWLETAAPGTGSPIHRHDCEEIFVVLKGTGTLYLASNPSNSEYPGTPQEIHISSNSTFHVPVNDVHQFVNTNKHGDLQVLVVISRPPIQAFLYEDWFTRHTDAKLKFPIFWDEKVYTSQENDEL